MRVLGPTRWESTARLQAALGEVESDLVLPYGVGMERKNGLEQLQLLTAAGIPCPIFTTSLDEAKQWVRDSHMIFGRALFHTQGRDIIGPGYRTGRVERWNPRWLASNYWVQFIPSEREFRQHIFNGKAIRLGEKSMIAPPWRRLLVRSRKNGWIIQYPPRIPPPEGIRKLAKAAVKAVGYLLGGVDIIESMNGELIVLEINSAPSMRDNATLAAYVKGVKQWTEARLKDE